MKAEKRKREFEASILDNLKGEILTFSGVEDFDVYNCSQPFKVDNDWYMFGRIERREEWMRSWVRLFTRTQKNYWELVKD